MINYIRYHLKTSARPNYLLIFQQFKDYSTYLFVFLFKTRYDTHIVILSILLRTNSILKPLFDSVETIFWFFARNTHILVVLFVLGKGIVVKIELLVLNKWVMNNLGLILIFSHNMCIGIIIYLLIFFEVLLLLVLDFYIVIIDLGLNFLRIKWLIVTSYLILLYFCRLF